MTAKLNLEGRSFHRLRVVGCAPSRSGMSQWVCECKCGNSVVVAGKSLVSGNTKSCGCLQHESRVANGKHNMKHGRASTNSHKRDRTYTAWFSMKSRCNRKSDKEYRRYGGSGVTYAKRWESFENFLYDMGVCPEQLTLDRVDPTGDYTPENCRWATRFEQSQNLRTTRRFEFDGKCWTISELAQTYDIPRGRVKYLLTEKGLTVREMLGVLHG